MRGAVLVLIVVLFLAVQSVPSSMAAETICPGSPLNIGMVMSTAPWESLTLVASYPVELDGWSISDGEGSVTFTKGALDAGDTLLMTTAMEATLIMPASVTITFSDPSLERRGRLALADGGDQVMLISPQGATVDILCYGGATTIMPWDGPPFNRMGAGEAAIHIDMSSLSADGWTLAPLGQTSLMPQEFQGSVEPFSCPEQARDRIMRELRYASQEVLVCVYRLDSPTIATALCGAFMRGVDVTVLVEGSPVGGIDDDALSQLATLSEYGVEVLTMRSNDTYRRYDYLHCKYAVFDSRRTMVMSDNWIDSALADDRGWGAVVDSRSLASYMRGLFLDDIDGIDIVTPDIDGVEPCAISILDDIPATPIEVFHASIIPILSPDNAEAAIMDLMDSAKERLLVEMFYIDLEWDAGSLLDGVIDAAMRGVATRLLLDSSWFTIDDNPEFVNRINLLARERGLDLEASLESGLHGFGLLHNKGMVVDDTVLISSINWCDSALHRNREVGLLIRSTELADRFADIFHQDWADDPEPPVAILPERIEANPDGSVLLNASWCHDNDAIVGYMWDVDGDGLTDAEGKMVSLVLPPGEHLVTLTVVDGHGNTANATTLVSVPEPVGDLDLPLPLVLSVPVGAIIAWRTLKKIKNRSRDSGR